jgi:hypothetical protein
MSTPVRNGDDHLSGLDRKLWDLTYHILMKYQVPVIFKVHGPNAPQKFDQYINFFIPANCDCISEISDFIFDEFKGDLREGEEIEDGSYFWGVHLHIYLYSGAYPYLEKPYAEQIARHGVAYLNRKIQEMKIRDKEKVIN